MSVILLISGRRGRDRVNVVLKLSPVNFTMKFGRIVWDFNLNVKFNGIVI